MMKYLFSPSGTDFYPLSLRSAYEKQGTWPDDGVEVSEETFIIYSGLAPEGKTRGADESGMPIWVDLPAPTKEELVASAENERSSRLESASSAITIWQTKLLMGRKLTKKETDSLNAWMDYIDELTDLDTALAPDITWPEKPTA